jgi:hypothetical protein
VHLAPPAAPHLQPLGQPVHFLARGLHRRGELGLRRFALADAGGFGGGGGELHGLLQLQHLPTRAVQESESKTRCQDNARIVGRILFKKRAIIHDATSILNPPNQKHLPRALT